MSTVPHRMIEHSFAWFKIAGASRIAYASRWVSSSSINACDEYAVNRRGEIWPEFPVWQYLMRKLGLVACFATLRSIKIDKRPAGDMLLLTPWRRSVWCFSSNSLILNMLYGPCVIAICWPQQLSDNNCTETTRLAQNIDAHGNMTCIILRLPQTSPSNHSD